MRLLCMPPCFVLLSSIVPPMLQISTAPLPWSAAAATWLWKSGFSSVPFSTPKKANPARRKNLRVSQPANPVASSCRGA